MPVPTSPSSSPCAPWQEQTQDSGPTIYALAAVSVVFFLTTVVLGTVLAVVLVRRRRNTNEFVRRDYAPSDNRYWENEIPSLENNLTPTEKERTIWFPETETASTFGGSSQPTNSSRATAKKGAKGWFTKKPARKAPPPPSNSEYAVPGSMLPKENPRGLNHGYRELDVTKVVPPNPYTRPIVRGNSMPTIHSHSLS